MSRFTISNSDLEILNALTIANSISKNLTSNSSFEKSNSYNASYGQGKSKRTISTTFSTNDSAIGSTNDSVICSTNDGSTASTKADVTSSTNLGAFCSSSISAPLSPYFDATCSTTDAAACSTDDSIQGIFRRANQTFTSFQLDSEYQAVLQDIQTVCLMNDITTERKRELENKRAITTPSTLSTSVLRKRLENINLVIKHILTISSQVSKVKQSLQDAPYKTTLKVGPSCQEDVVKFFHTADAIIKKLQDDSSAVKFYNKSVAQVIPVDETALHSKLQAIITGLARRLDILTEFRNCLLAIEES
ncbi:hypothetical protein JTE90_018808 [Oedothorax gibbosus]|uniref:Uncharacterized protein n=1 Tax=Oedothorax gibbosus TaxID=931172 RepID=A0AAV6U3H3_9ARAC|nr:hypothetical protein JTE90_018808 [Oedothorax gibbosus]